MAQVCNVQQAVDPGGQNALYLESERYIEGGSAYFVQAFAEVLGLISDLELHDPERAQLRLLSTSSLLECALRQYVAAVESGSRSGLYEYHERKLREVGLDSRGVRHVLSEALSRGFLVDNERVEMLAANFDRMGCSGLMGLYIEGVREIHGLTVTMSESEGPERDAVMWQELGWKLTTLFAQTLEVGKAIAILNIFTFRVPLGALAAAANRGKSNKLNS